MPLPSKYNKPSLRILLPENLNLTSHLEAFPPKFSYKVSRFMYILSLVTERFGYDHRLLEVKDTAPYVPLSAAVLNEVVPHYQRYLRYLCQTGILECDEICSPGAKCRGYRFAEAYHTKVTVTTITPETDHILIEKDEARRATLQQKAKYLYPELTGWLDRLVFDKEAAIAFTEQDYQIKAAAAKTPKQRCNALNEYNSHMAMIERFVNPNCVYTVDAAGHRLHTKLTNLWSLLRQFITFQGHPLVATDLSCSQPYLATTLLQYDFYDDYSETGRLTVNQLPEDVQQMLYCKPSAVNSLDSTSSEEELIMAYQESSGATRVSSAQTRETWAETPVSLVETRETYRATRVSSAQTRETLAETRQEWALDSYQTDQLSDMRSLLELYSKYSYSKVPNPLMLDISDQPEECRGELEAYQQEVGQYIESVEQGRFYERLGEQASAKTGKASPERKRLKEIVLSTLYSKNSDTRDFIVAARSIFQQVFPRVYEVFRELKTRAHRELPVLLQGIEAELFLNRISRRISREKPHLPIYSLHDSIITIDGEQEYVREVMHDELYKATGVKPHFKQEKWGHNGQ